ncbi:hypothetical protein BDR26DRAFT_1009371 [Obelidium mucronatum]|nr:hypothetical protein BDR26DRAFT_1009371 [Obelidium mucronatum]
MSFGGIGTSNSFGNNVANAWATGDFGNEDLVSSSVAASHLKKLGWKHGEGLGKKKDGINRAISVGFKNDTKGIGSTSNEFGFSWWDHVFNKASSQIQIDKDDDGEIQVKVEKNSSKAKQLLYGSFTTAGGGNDDEKDFSIKVTDEELFIACEGRTARKGARAEQPGKLKRAVKSSDEIEVITISESVTSTSVSSTKVKKDKKKKKDKSRKDGDEEVQVVEEKKKKKRKHVDEEEEKPEVATEKRKKSKKERKNKEEDVEVPQSSKKLKETVADSDGDVETKIKKSKSKKRLEDDKKKKKRTVE